MTPPRVDRASAVIENARVVHHDQIDDAPLAFASGRVTNAPVGDDAFRIDLRGHLVFPGLINAHDHLHLNNVPPLPHADPFANSYAWIEAFEPHRLRPDVAAAVGAPKAMRHWQGGLKNLLAGVTTVAHHDPWHDVLDDPAFPVDLLRDFGWAHSLGLGEPRGNERRERAPQGGEARHAEAQRDGLPRYGPPVRESFAATPPDRPWIVHLAEGTDRVARAELARLDALECLAANTVLVHGAGLTSADVERVLERGAAVVWCPASNLELLGRTLDVRHARRLFDAGRLALGSDSRLTGSRDLLDEMRVAASCGDLSPAELFRLVTADASRVLRLADRGTLDVGRRADCIIMQGEAAGADPYRTLLDARRCVIRAVVRGGVPVVGDPDFAEWFARCGVDAVRVLVDGRPKLAARAVVPNGVARLEPGLELAGSGPEPARATACAAACDRRGPTRVTSR